MALGKSLPPCEDFRIRSGAHREGHCKVEVKFFALQGGSSGRVDIQLKVLPDYKLLILCSSPNGFLGLSLNDKNILFLVILLDKTVSVG